MSLVKLLFERYDTDITMGVMRFPANNENLFSMCCEGANEEMLDYLICVLRGRLVDEEKIQRTLVATILTKMSRSFEYNFEIIRAMLYFVEDKQLLYEQLLASDKYRLMQPSEHDLKTATFAAPVHFCCHITNSYFIKLQMLVKFNIIPESGRLYWVLNYINAWIEKCFGRRPYVSACSAIRYLTFDDMLTRVATFYEYLLSNNHIDVHRLAKDWWFHSYEFQIGSLIDAESIRKLDAKFRALGQFYRATPRSLRAICCHHIRDSLRTLSKRSVKQLELPAELGQLLYA